MAKNYTISELSKRLKVSQRTLLREIKRGNLASNKVGRRFLISQKQLNTYLARELTDTDKLVQDYLKEKKPEMINLLQRMITMPSESKNFQDELRLAKFIKKFLDKQGIRNRLYKKGEAIALRATYGYADKGLLLDCPLDTTPAGDRDKWTFPPYEGVIKSGKMYGRGTADCKAGMVCMIYSVMALKKFVDEEKVRIEMVFDGGEQSGAYLGMKLIADKGIYANSGIVGYAGDSYELPVGARGYHRYTIIAKGESAHTGGRYRKGVNAISKMAKLICELEGVKMPVPKGDYFKFGQRLTVAIIRGGRAINITPDECVAQIDVRTSPEFKRSGVTKLIQSTINRITRIDNEAEFKLTYDLGQEGYSFSEKNKLIKSLSNAIKVNHGKSVETIANGPAHIGNLLAEYGIPVTVWGPRGGKVHSYDEFIELDSLTKTSKVYFDMTKDYFMLSE